MSTENKSIVTDGIKSQDRVKKHGEVFTPVHIVKDMTGMINKSLNEKLDEEGIEDITERNWQLLNKTWLEPACGTGNFLVEILKDNLTYIENIIKEQGIENVNVDLCTLIAVATIYGIDIQLDNVLESRARLIDTPAPDDQANGYETVTAWYKRVTGKEMSEELLDSVRYITEKNIIHGNALTGTFYTGEGDEAEDTKQPMTIVGWNPIEEENKFKIEEVDFNSMKSGGTGTPVIQPYVGESFEIYRLRTMESFVKADDDLGDLDW